MCRKLFSILILAGLATVYLRAQTTTGLMTGTITDPAGAVVPSATVSIINQGTSETRTTSTNDSGIYLIPQVQPGVYRMSVAKQGFATIERSDIRLEVSQSITLDFQLSISSTRQTITITGGAPLLNTTSATLSDVVDQEQTVDLPLNGRNFTQLALLAPGADPIQDTQQTTFGIVEGNSGVSPSVNGQQGYQNNYTMDGVLNNALFTDVWAIAPPPDAIQEFAVQSHITDAQFAISSGANINVVTRSGTNTYHGSLWEFLRNDAFDTQTYPATSRLPYHQNQYGFWLGGPFTLPHIINGKNNTWFSAYWEGFRSAKTATVIGDTLPTPMLSGNFSGVLGTTQIGTDCNGTPEYKSEIYDPTTSVPDPCHSGEYLRKPFDYNGELNVIPPGDINSASTLIAQKYYPAPNLSVAVGVLPNYSYPGRTTIASDVSGIRLDHQFNSNNIVFARVNRSNVHETEPEALPTYDEVISEYAVQAVLGYTHTFNPSTLLNFRYGYTYANLLENETPAGTAFSNSINWVEAMGPTYGIQMGPQVSISNGYSGITQAPVLFGPQQSMDYHLDFTKIKGSHSLSAGAMYFHVREYSDGWEGQVNFTGNATSQDGTSGPTGYAAASFMLGALDSYIPFVGNHSADQTTPWWGLYVQDQWQATRNLVLIGGLRWDYVAPANFHRVIGTLNIMTGQFAVNEPYPPLFSQATLPSGLFYPEHDGFEPRFGFTYRPLNRTVIHSAFAMFDDHNNDLVQKNQGPRASWPLSAEYTIPNLDVGVPTEYLNNLPGPSTILNANTPEPTYSLDPHDPIPYIMEFNFGVQQQLSNSLALKLDYVGSLTRHGYMVPSANTAITPGPGPVAARAEFPQWPVANCLCDRNPASYDAFQVHLEKSLSSGLEFLTSYTWQKSEDQSSDPYFNEKEENWYDLKAEWGRSDYSLNQVFVLSGIYAIPVGRGMRFVGNANTLEDEILGHWNATTIVSLHSGLPFHAIAGSDVANVGDAGNSERADRIAGVSPYNSPQTPQHWLNAAGFEVPAPYTFGTESRDDLSGPAYRDVDFSVFKNFPLHESASLQFRGEFFNILNTTNYNNPTNNASSSSFGAITSAISGRDIQFALKVLF